MFELIVADLKGLAKWIEYSDGTHIINPAYLDEWRQANGNK